MRRKIQDGLGTVDGVLKAEATLKPPQAIIETSRHVKSVYVISPT
ncbi:MAG: hypothetical protein AAFY08_09290 [Planctomycetota bacterium]